MTTNGTTDLPVILTIRPGTSAEKSMRISLPKDHLNDTSDQVVKYAASLPKDAFVRMGSERVQERLQREISSGKYVISANGQAIKPDSALKDYLTTARTEKSGKEYLTAELLVAAGQSGANLETRL